MVFLSLTFEVTTAMTSNRFGIDPKVVVSCTMYLIARPMKCENYKQIAISRGSMLSWDFIGSPDQKNNFDSLCSYTYELEHFIALF